MTQRPRGHTRAAHPGAAKEFAARLVRLAFGNEVDFIAVFGLDQWYALWVEGSEPHGELLKVAIPGY